MQSLKKICDMLFFTPKSGSLMAPHWPLLALNIHKYRLENISSGQGYVTQVHSKSLTIHTHLFVQSNVVEINVFIFVMAV